MYEYFNLVSDVRVATSLFAALLGLALLSVNRDAEHWVKWIGGSAFLYGSVFVVIRVIQLTIGIDLAIGAPLVSLVGLATLTCFVSGLRSYFKQQAEPDYRFCAALFVGGLLSTLLLIRLTHGWLYAGPAVVSTICFCVSVWMVRTWWRTRNRLLLVLAVAFDLHPLFLAWSVSLGVPLEQFRGNVVVLIVSIFVVATAMLLQHQAQRLQSELQLRIKAEDGLRQLTETLESKVEARTQQLEELVQGLKSFSGMVSHDLKGPLGNVVTVSELARRALANGDLAKVEHYLALLSKEGHRSVTMVTDLLMLARAEHDAIKRTMVDFNELTKECVQSLALSYPDAAGKILVEAMPHASADRGLMSHVLHNVLGNALKFGQRTPDLQIVVRSARDGAFWRFEVSDNGPGFDASNGHDVFEPFVRLGHAVSGTGLGLSVAKKIVDSHGGAMGVHAAPGEGARFWWTLPMASGGIGISS